MDRKIVASKINIEETLKMVIMYIVHVGRKDDETLNNL